MGVERWERGGRAVLAGLAIAGYPAPAALAQVEPDADVVLEEIVVTAQKREQSLRDVPISVSVVGGETLESRAVADLAALSHSVPNLSVNNAALNNLVFVRGIGSGSNVGFEQSVGLFLDEVYVSRVRYMRAPFLDVQRVEVLKGPQGTLFGRNTIAGAISVTAASPTPDLQLSADALYDATLDGWSLTGVASGPLGDRLSARLALRTAGGGDYVENSASGAAGPEKDERAARASFAWAAADDLAVTLKLEYSDFEVTGSTLQVGEAGPVLPRFLAVDPAFETRVDERRSVGGLTRDRDRTQTELATLRIDWDVADLRLTSLSAYAAYGLERDVDTDFSPLPFLATLVPDETFDQFSQELRLTSGTTGRLQWIAGLYAETNEFRTLDRTDINGPGSGSPALAPAVASSVTRFDQDADVLSAFGQLEFALTDALSLTAGLRWNREDKEGRLDHRVTQSGTLTTPLASAAARTVLRVGFGREDAVIAADTTEEKTTPSLTLSWRQDGTLLYASYTEGFKAGGFNGAQTAPATATNPFQFAAEEARAYELGAKWAWRNALELNASLFNTDYENLQVSVLTGASFSVGNAAEARSRGVELDARWKAASWLTLGAAVAYLDSEYTRYPNAQCPARLAASPFPTCTRVGTVLVQDLTGEPLIYAPEWSGTLSAAIDAPLGERLKLLAQLSLDATASYLMTQDNDPIDGQSGFGKVDLRIGLADPDERWEVALVGRNLTDRATSHVANDLPALTGAHYRSFDPPRSVALQLRFRN